MQKSSSETEDSINTARKRILSGDYDIPLTSGLHRAEIQGRLDPEELKRLGFFESYMAVPERGQSSLKTYRTINGNEHLHRHDKSWYMHIDEYPSLQTVLRRLKQSEAKAIVSGKDYSESEALKKILKAYVEGSRHALFEGIPGYMNYIQGHLGNTPDFAEIKRLGKDDYSIGRLLSAVV